MHAHASTQAGYDAATVDVLVDALLERLPARGALFAGLSGLQASGSVEIGGRGRIADGTRFVPGADRAELSEGNLRQ